MDIRLAHRISTIPLICLSRIRGHIQKHHRGATERTAATDWILLEGRHRFFDTDFFSSFLLERKEHPHRRKYRTMRQGRHVITGREGVARVRADYNAWRVLPLP